MTMQGRLWLAIPIAAIIVVGSYATVSWVLPQRSQDPCVVTGGTGSLEGLISANAPLSALVMPAGCNASLTGYFAEIPASSQGSLTIEPYVWFVANLTNGTTEPTSAVTVQAQPSIIYLSGTGRVNLTYFIHAAQNATGFYFVGIFGRPCPGFRLAVGYNPSQVNLSDWPGGVAPFRGCYPAPGSFTPTSTVNASLTTIYSG